MRQVIYVFLDELSLEYFLGGVESMFNNDDDDTDNGELGKELEGELYELEGGADLLVRLFSILAFFLFPSFELGRPLLLFFCP